MLCNTLRRSLDKTCDFFWYKKVGGEVSFFTQPRVGKKIRSGVIIKNTRKFWGGCLFSLSHGAVRKYDPFEGQGDAKLLCVRLAKISVKFQLFNKRRTNESWVTGEWPLSELQRAHKTHKVRRPPKMANLWSPRGWLEVIPFARLTADWARIKPLFTLLHDWLVFRDQKS